MAAYKLYIKFYVQTLLLITAYVAPLTSTTMKIIGTITVSGLKEGVSLGEESFLTVKLEDTGRMDAGSVLIGKDEQVLPARTLLGPGSEGLNYTIVFEKPESLSPMYTVFAVINVGWKAAEKKWIRKGDYLTETSNVVDLTQETNPIVADIEMVRYPKLNT